jgi:hypothetical protein
MSSWFTYLFVGAALINGMARSEPRPTVIELFTSEGCSSCPPAEELLAELAQRSDVLPLSFHVDYWNGLGWHDTFTFPGATRRQHNYAANLHRNSVYTPQVVIDGESDLVGSDRRSILESLSHSRDGVATHIAIADSRILISISALAGARAADVLLIGYLRQATAHIGRGENSGRTLQEFNIVRSVQLLGSWDGAARSFSAPLASLPPDATHVALIVQAAGQGAILGAASIPMH